MSDWRRCQEWETYTEITQYTATSSNRDNAEIQTKDMTGVEGSYDLYKETRGLDATAQCWHVNQLSDKKSFNLPRRFSNLEESIFIEIGRD